MAEVHIGSGNDEENSGLRLVVLNLPSDEGEGLGFRLTRTLWDPYPWVREVVAGSRAYAAGLKKGDCLMQVGGRDLLGMPVSQVAGLIRGDGGGGGVSLLAWNCGVDPSEDPELLWSVGGGSRGERSRRALAGVVRALACCVCASTATKALSCARSHLYCEGCWSRLERCALCRETLPAKDSPYARNLVAEQVFEAIATEYELKEALQRQQTSSVNTTPNVSPCPSPSTLRRKGQYQLSLMRKRVQFNDKTQSDPNIHRSISNCLNGNIEPHAGCCTSGNTGANYLTGNTEQNGGINGANIPRIVIENADDKCCKTVLQNKFLARLRPACSLVDLQNASLHSCAFTRSMSNVSLGGACSSSADQNSGSLDDLKQTRCDSPVLLPVFLLACDHDHKNIG